MSEVPTILTPSLFRWVAWLRRDRSVPGLDGRAQSAIDQRELVLYAGLYTISAALLRVVGFVLFLWMARTLSVAAYAAFGLAYALQTCLTMVSIAGVVEAVVALLRAPVSNDRGDLAAAANSAFLWMAGPVSVLSVLLFVLLVRPSQTEWPMVASVVGSGLLLAFASLQSQVVRLQEKHLASILFGFLVPLAGFLGGYIALRVEPSMESFFAGNTIGAAVSLVALGVFGAGTYRVRALGDARYAILGRVGPFVGIAALGWLGGYGNSYLVEGFFQSPEVAKFTFALMISSIMQLIATALNQVWSPRFFKLVRETSFDEVERGNRWFFRWQGITLGVSGGALMALFPPAVSLLGGNLIAYRSIQLELLFLVAAYVLMSPWWHCYNFYIAHGEGRDLMRIMVLTSTAGVLTWILLMWALGPIGIYAGFMTQMLLRMVTIVVLARRKWPVRIAWSGVIAGLILNLTGFAVAQLQP